MSLINPHHYFGLTLFGAFLFEIAIDLATYHAAIYSLATTLL
jgi:hypothetical protein